MCGICGTAGFSSPELLDRMSAVMRHRGPDDEGVYVSPDRMAALGSRRLSIIDITRAGHMPMANDAGTLHLAYNGEVYNFQELRAQLEATGHRFHSRTDTEVVLRLYEAHGLASLAMLNGMFAIALWDARSRELILARDRTGIKPLYYAVRPNGQLLFGSEIKSILQDPSVPRELDLEAVHGFLAHLWVPGPNTMLRGIQKLPPGHYLRWHDGEFEVQPYWRMTWAPRADRPEQDLTAELRALLQRVVARQLVADVPVGLFLSGGLDSSALLALMSAAGHGQAHAYTIAFRQEDQALEQGAGQDAAYARRIADMYGARLEAIEIRPNMVELLPRVLWHLDEPVADPAAVNTLLISEAASREAKVLLSGQGADEVFGGYRVHLADRFATWASRIPGPLRRQVLPPLLAGLPAVADRVPVMHPGLARAVDRYFRKVLKTVDMTPVERYLFNRTFYDAPSQIALYAESMRAAFAGFDSLARHRAYFAEVADQPFVNQMLHVDIKTFLPELNLTYGDKLSMAASVEVRVPFLDNEVLDFMATVPPGLKIRGLTGKYILRQAMKGLVPDEILTRRKVGFGAPIRRWLDGDLAEMVGDLLSPARLRRRGLFDPAAVERLLADQREEREDRTYQIWALLTLELWQQIFLDGASPGPVPAGAGAVGAYS